MPAEIRDFGPPQIRSTSAPTQKDDLAAKLALLGSHPFSPSSLSHKPPAPDPVKKKAVEYKFKCPIKSCGKIMTSEPSYHSHMKRHSDKKPTKRDPATDGQDHRFDA